MFIVIIQGAFLPVPPVQGGAVEKRWFLMGQEFAALGHQVVHISRSIPGFPDTEEINGVLYLRVRGFDAPSSLLKLKMLDFFYSLRAINKLPKEADIIITNTFWSPFLLRGQTGRKIFVDVARMPKGQMRFYVNSLCLRANSSAVAEAIKRELPKKYHPKVSMIPNPLPFVPASEIDFSKKQPIILYVGRIHPEKGLEILINAYKKSAMNYKLQIIGPWQIAAGGGGKEYLEALKALSQSAVEFLEPVFDSEKLNSYYLSASIFVYPSVAEKGETFGLAPLEAMALGCVPVVSDLLCFKDFIRHRENGLVFDHRHKDADIQLRDLLLLLTSDTVYREKLAKSALEVRKTHSASNIAYLFISEFERLRKRRFSIYNMFIVIIQGAFLPVPPVQGGAVEKIWFLMGQEFAALGHQVVHISRSIPGFPDTEEINGVLYLRVRGFDAPSSLLKLKMLDFFYSLRAINKLPKEADIIITNTFWSPFLLRGQTGRKIFVDVQRMPKGQMRFYVNSLCLRANSSAVAEAIKRELPKKYHPKVSMIPNPLPFVPASEIDFSKKQPIILYVGRIHPEKGLEILINAYKKSAMNYKLQIIGPWQIAAGGGGKEYLEALKALSQSAVEFLEPVFDSEKLNSYYLSASIFVYPSVAEKGETFGLAPLEAMALGCVPVVSDLLCFKDFIRHRENGLVFDHRHKDADIQLRDLLLLLTSDTVYREKLAKSALEVRKTHSASNIAYLFISEFERLRNDNE